MRDLNEILGAGMRQCRLMAGFKTLAEAQKAAKECDPPIDISINGLSMIETGKRWPRLETLNEFARLYKCQAIDFFTITLENQKTKTLIVDKEVKDAIVAEVEAALLKRGHTKKGN